MKMRVSLQTFLLISLLLCNITTFANIFAPANPAKNPFAAPAPEPAPMQQTLPPALGILALPNDNQALSITSDSFHYDNQKGVATYTGNVVAYQGDRGLTGDRLEIYRNTETGKIDKIIVEGKPANYHGASEPGQPLIYAKADQITYVVAKKFLTLTGNAEVEQEGDIYRSWKIEYDGLKDTVYSPPSKEGRTTILLKDDGDAKF